MKIAVKSYDGLESLEFVTGFLVNALESVWKCWFRLQGLGYGVHLGSLKASVHLPRTLWLW